MVNWAHIIEGWRNHLIPPVELKTLILQTSEERLLICRNCEHHSSRIKTIRIDEHCTICGCPLKALTKCLSCNCSVEELQELPKWEAVVSCIQEEEFNIEEDEEENCD
jgi:hypothetical protein